MITLRVRATTPIAASDRGLCEAVSGRSEERQDAVGAPGKGTGTGGILVTGERTVSRLGAVLALRFGDVVRLKTCLIGPSCGLVDTGVIFERATNPHDTTHSPRTPVPMGLPGESPSRTFTSAAPAAVTVRVRSAPPGRLYPVSKIIRNPPNHPKVNVGRHLGSSKNTQVWLVPGAGQNWTTEIEK